MIKAFAQMCHISSKGAAFLELAIVLPIVLALLLGAVEFSRELRTKLQVSGLAQQVAEEAFRRCWDRVRYAGSAGAENTEAQGCLEDFNDARLRNMIASVDASAVVRVTMFRCPKAGATFGANLLKEKIVYLNLPPSGNLPSFYMNEAKFNGSASDSLFEICNSKSPIVSVEAKIRYKPIIPSFPKFFNAVDGELYAVSYY